MRRFNAGVITLLIIAAYFIATALANTFASGNSMSKRSSD